MPESTDLVIRDESSLELDTYAQYEGLGLENISNNDLIIPRITILQAMSPAVNADEPLGRSGDIFNVTTNENYGRSINFVALAYWMNRTKWEGDIGSDIECSAIDGSRGSKFGNCTTCKFKNFSNDGEAPACTEFKNLLMIPFRDISDILDSSWGLFSAKRAAIRSINRLLTAYKMLSQGGKSLPMFASVWEMKSEAQQQKTGKGTYYTPGFRRLGFIPNELIIPLGNRAQEFAEMQKEAMRVVAEGNAAEDGAEKTQTIDGDESSTFDDNVPY